MLLLILHYIIYIYHIHVQIFEGCNLIVFAVNWSSMKFLSSKFHWQNFSLHLFSGHQDTHEWLHLTLASDDGKFSTLPAAIAEVASKVVDASLRLTIDRTILLHCKYIISLYTVKTF